jgi:cation diffusion facilitator CzcD-associated flavoprotein CzcO
MPRFTVGCKRLILSNEYYAALQQPNVELIPHGLAAANGSSLMASDGTAREVDVVLFASGFELRHPPIAARVRGRNGRLLSEIWRDQSPRAYRGTTIPGFPNAYFLLGPNSVMYNSLLAVAEWQSSYIAEAILSVRHRQLRAVEIHPVAFNDFNRRIEADIDGTAYNRGGCQSIYLDEAGHNFVTNPWPARKLRRSLRKFDAQNYWAPDGGRPQRLPDDPAA